MKAGYGIRIKYPDLIGPRHDRHEKLGQGAIGMEAMKRIVQHPALAELPFILETPNDDDGYKKEIQLVRSWMDAG